MFAFFTGIILLAASIPFPAFISPLALTGDVRVQRDFTERLGAISINNPTGPVEVQTWSAAFVRVIVSPQDEEGGSKPSSEIIFEQPAKEAMAITVKARAGSSPISISVFLPATVRVTIKGSKEPVIIKGPPTSLSVETESGNITLRLAEGTNSDISVRTIQGTIESRVPVKIFGQADAHMLDGRMGQGGAPLILRSSRGNISLLPDDGARVTATPTLTAPTAANAVQAFTTTSQDGGAASPLNIKPAGNKEAATFDKDEASKHTDEHVIKLEGRLVNLNVKVSDRMGKPLAVLKKDDFQVTEDNVPQDVAYFEPINSPLNIVLLMDLSGSTEKKIKTMKKAAKKFIDCLGSADRIAIAGFTRRFFVISNFTTDHKLLKKRIDDIKNRHSGTAFYDAMWATLDLFDEANASRKAIVVLTDGVDNSLDHPDDSDYDPKHSFAELMARIEEADATIYPIYLDTEYESIGRHGRDGHDAYQTARKQLEAVAEQTGAVLFKANLAEDLEGVYQQVAAELHSLYSMAYAPKSMSRDGKWRKISVKVTRDGAVARTKRGYFAR
jgi:VWFA-related protein